MEKNDNRLVMNVYNTNKNRKSSKFNLFAFLVFILLMFSSVLMIGLLILGIITSLKQESDISIDSNIFGLPNMEWWKWDQYYPNNIFGNYLYAFKNLTLKMNNTYIVGLFNPTRVKTEVEVNLFTAFLNTILYAGVGGFFQAFIPLFMGYLCAKYKNKLSRVFYLIALFVIAIPIVGNQPSVINLMRNLRLFDTLIGDWIRRSTFTNVYFLLFYAYFTTIPDDYGESAEIDGATQFSTMFRIYLPLALPMFFTIYLLVFVAAWNDFTTPMLYMPSYPTISYLLYFKTTVNSGSAFNSDVRRMAALMLSAIPITVLFIAFNKRLMTNLAVGGIKG